MAAPQTSKQNLESLRAAFEQHHIQRVKIGGFDVDGILRGKYVSLDKFWSVVESGLGFCDVIFGWDSADVLYDRSKVTGWHTGYPDAPAKVDLDTFRPIPWEPGTASFLLDFEDANGRPLEVSPRQVLDRVLEKAKSLGLSVMASAEFEFFIYQESPWTLKEKGYRNARPLSPGMFGYSWIRTSQRADLVHAIFDSLAAFDVEVEGFHTETGPGVFEAAIRYDGAKRAADKAALFKTAVKEICHRHELMASFMAKPSSSLPGCSGHLHQSLWSADGKNLFFDERGEHSTSKVLRHYVAGQVLLMPELCAMIAPNVNSYRRMVPGTWAPTAATWGFENRTTALRVIGGSPKSTRVEYRLAAADINPYIALAASIGAGLYGVEKKLEPPAPIVGNGYEAKDAPPLPRNLREATAWFERSAIARELFGQTFVEHYAMTRDFECRQAELAVTDWELQRYFELA
jgi:glutamine synthetase